jgi:ABC-2 type transport system ATP-binding protein
VHSSEYPISTHNLEKQYSNSTRIGPISIDIEKKWIFGFLGPNGAGKTTTIRMLLGLVRSNSGSVKIFGEDPLKNPAEALKNIGYAPELPTFQTFFNGEDLLSFTAKLHGIGSLERKKRVKKLITMVGLGDHSRKKIGKYSKGMIQRLSVAQALINDPEILILDEPTLGMDPAATIYFRDLFKSLVSEGRTILISSHQLDEIQRLATHIGMINHGRIVLQGTTSSILSTFAKEYSIQIELEKNDNSLLDKIKSLSYVKSIRVAKGRIHITPTEQKDMRANLANDIVHLGGRILELSFSKASLEDAFIETLGRGVS